MELGWDTLGGEEDKLRSETKNKAVATPHRIKKASRVGGYVSSVFSGLGCPPGAESVA
jgi:hypothetical protein